MNKVYYFHTPVRKGLHRYTVAGVFIPKAVQSDEPYQLSLAFARCSFKDHFSKKLGRMIAEGRLKKMTPTHSLFIHGTKESSGKEFLRQALDFIRSYDPGWLNEPMVKPSAAEAYDDGPMY